MDVAGGFDGPQVDSNDFCVALPHDVSVALPQYSAWLPLTLFVIGVLVMCLGYVRSLRAELLPRELIERDGQWKLALQVVCAVWALATELTVLDRYSGLIVRVASTVSRPFGMLQLQGEPRGW